MTRVVHGLLGLVALLAVAAALGACGLFVKKERVTSTPVEAYPPGVGGPVEAVVVYPAGTPRALAVRDFLARGRARGAGWVSHLTEKGLGDDPCVTRLLPGTRAQQVTTTYLTSYKYRDPHHRDKYELSTEDDAVEVPFVREIDDVDGIVHDVDAWTAAFPSGCARGGRPVELSAFLHGRTPVGVDPDDGRVDLRKCSAGLRELAVGSADALALADEVLPGWTGAEVTVLLPSRATRSGTLTRYYLGNMTIQAGADTLRVHVMDAVSVHLDAPAVAPTVSAQDPVCAVWEATLRAGR